MKSKMKRIFWGIVFLGLFLYCPCLGGRGNQGWLHRPIERGSGEVWEKLSGRHGYGHGGDQRQGWNNRGREEI